MQAKELLKSHVLKNLKKSETVTYTVETTLEQVVGKLWE